MPRTQKRAPIPPKTRQALWIAAGGRCEFRGCNKPVSRDFLTKRTANVGELAHIIADSPEGARGVKGLSEALAKDERNLMLACFDCHNRVDRDGKTSEYSAADLQAMKREHEARIELIYSSAGVKDSLPILMSFPVGSHAPVVDVRDVHYAMLENTRYKRFPVGRYIHIDRADFDVLDSSPDFWPRAEASLQDIFDRRVRPEMIGKQAPTHLTVAAFAPIPMLMKLGALLGDKMDAMVLDLPTERWLWDKSGTCETPEYRYDVPTSLPCEVAAVVSISNRATSPTSGMPIVEFSAVSPNRSIIRTEAHVIEFRRQFNAFLMSLVRAGIRVLHLYPATPLCASVEIGRMLLPKTLDEVYVWEWQESQWRLALRLK
ncbi:MAG: SAVED domain-containing protein [Rhodocyclaceae bacterium]|nr:MAG: SAVED domain-containing protein [Rhodocyclaceae bacterium]